MQNIPDQQGLLLLTWINLIKSSDIFAYGMTAELSWHVQNCDLIESLKSNLEQNYLLQDFNNELITYSFEMGSRSFMKAGLQFQV